MKTKKKRLDYHEGFSDNQCKIILDEMGLDYKKFSKWMNGQTRPIIPRENKMGIVERVGGTFEWDLFRWVSNQRRGTALIWD